MKTLPILFVLFCGAVACLADSSVDAILRGAPSLNSSGSGFPAGIQNNIDVILYVPSGGIKRAGGIKLDLISEPDFEFRPARRIYSQDGESLDLAK